MYAEIQIFENRIGLILHSLFVKEDLGGERRVMHGEFHEFHINGFVSALLFLDYLAIFRCKGIQIFASICQEVRQGLHIYLIYFV